MAVAAKVKEPSIDHMETRWIDVFGTGFGAGEDNHVHKGKTTIGYGNYPTKGNPVGHSCSRTRNLDAGTEHAELVSDGEARVTMGETKRDASRERSVVTCLWFMIMIVCRVGVPCDLRLAVYSV